MPDTSPSPGIPARWRHRSPSPDWEEHKSLSAGVNGSHVPSSLTGDPGQQRIAPAERHEPRWRDLQWVDFTTTIDIETSPSAAPGAPDEAGLGESPPPDSGDFAQLLHQLTRTPGIGEQTVVSGLAPRFVRLTVPRRVVEEIELAQSAELIADDVETQPPAPIEQSQTWPEAIEPSTVIEETTPAVAAPDTDPEPPVVGPEPPAPEPPAQVSPKIETAELLEGPVATPTARSRDDDYFPASILTHVDSPLAPPLPTIAQSLGMQLGQAGAALRRQREAVGARLVRARGAPGSLATPLPQSTEATPPRAERSPTPASGPAFRSPPKPAVAGAAAPSAALGRQPPSGIFVLADQVHAKTLRLAGDDPLRLRRWLTLGGGVIVIAAAAYAIGATVTGLRGSDTRPPVVLKQPAPAPQIATAQPQPSPTLVTPPPPEPATPPSDPVARAAFYLAHAKAGDPVAQYDVGVLYASGQGLVQDYASAASWFRAAAAQGNIDAEYNLGVLYEQGLGVTADPIEAVNWYRSAADRNHAAAQYNLALAYTEGRGTEQDLAAAARWYQRAAQQGVAPAMFNLAILYERGQGVDRSPADAYAWYRAAAERGYAPAKQRADELYGQFGDQDKAKAQGLAATIAASINGAPPPA